MNPTIRRARPVAVMAVAALCAACQSAPVVPPHTLEDDLDARLNTAVANTSTLVAEMQQLEARQAVAPAVAPATLQMKNALDAQMALNWNGSAESVLKYISESLQATFVVIGRSGTVPMVSVKQGGDKTARDALQSVSSQVSGVADVAIVAGPTPRVELRYHK